MMIDNKIIEQTRNTDIIAFFEQHYGFEFVHRGGTYRCQQHPSLAVKNNRLSWYWHSKGIGGFGVLDYLVKVENMPFREAVETAAGICIVSLPQHRVNLSRCAEPSKTLILPEKSGVPIRLYDYLCCKRGIDSDIVNTLLQDEKLYEDKRNNIVFVGYDEHNKPRFASLRGTYNNFRMDCAGSDKCYGFNMAYMPSERLYIFE